jgi:hypothetical protein
MVSLSTLVLRFRLPIEPQALANASAGFFSHLWGLHNTLTSLVVIDDSRVMRTLALSEFDGIRNIVSTCSSLKTLRLPGNWAIVDDPIKYPRTKDSYTVTLEHIGGHQSFLKAFLHIHPTLVCQNMLVDHTVPEAKPRWNLALNSDKKDDIFHKVRHLYLNLDPHAKFDYEELSSLRAHYENMERLHVDFPSTASVCLASECSESTDQVVFQVAMNDRLFEAARLFKQLKFISAFRSSGSRFGPGKLVRVYIARDASGHVLDLHRVRLPATPHAYALQ